MAQRLRKGDMVVVLTGKYKSQRGKITKVEVERGRVRVEGLFVQRRHLKAKMDKEHPDGGMVQRFGSIHISNVMLWDASINKGTKVGFVINSDGSKVRVSKRSGQVMSTVRESRKEEIAG